MESEKEEKISKAGDAVEEEEGEEVFNDAVEEKENTEENPEEGEKEEKMETRKEKERVNVDKDGDRNKKKEVGESAIPCKLKYVGLTKPTFKEIRGYPVWLRLVKIKRRNWLSRANLEDVRSQTKRDG